MEIRLGRPIVPHRDIVESNESDFDSESASKSTDTNQTKRRITF